jgi:tetratricopeptide (TPR) repeat protein|eukprot:Stramenopile-MAST_4_protein_4282
MASVATNATVTAGGVEVTPALLCERGGALAQEGNLELAYQFFGRAVTNAPNDPHVLAMYAEFLAGSLGDVEEAKKVLESCVQCGGRGQVYFSLGQVQTGMDAVQSFRAGIEQLEHDPQNNEIIASAYCRICEVFMTDLCFEENAEQICVTCATKAVELSVGGGRVEALHCWASVLISQQKTTEAKAEILKAFAILQDLEDDDEIIEVADVVEYEMRLNVSKVLIEVGCGSEASIVLEALLLESDADIEVWYCCGLAYRQQELYAEALPYLETAATMIQSLPGEDRAHMEEQVSTTVDEVKEKVAAAAASE